MAIIIDSFVEAAQSRVLWVLLVAWTIILAAIAPFAILEGTTSLVQTDQILDVGLLQDSLAQAGQGKGTAAQQAIWNALEARFQQNIENRQRSKRPGRIPVGYLVSELNRVLDKPDLYVESAWPTAAKRSELKPLLEVSASSLSPLQLQKRNRELLELAFPRAFRPGDSDALWIGYAGMKVSDPLPFSRKQVRPLFEGIVLMAIFKIGLGLFGTFIGIIITSPMIPDLFQVGSLHLLLSKPISRSWLLVAKFIGGTGFVFLNVAFLLIGFYLLVGWRLGFWNQGILYCIPIFVFVFMIYYSVSMLAGLIWRNAIVSIVITALFWGMCTVLGITHGVMQSFVTELPEITQIKPIGDQVISVARSGQIRLWDHQKNRWQNAYGESFGEEAVIGPFWLPKHQSLYFGRGRRSPFGGMQNEEIRLQMVSLPELHTSMNHEVEKTSKANSERDVSSQPLWSDKRLDVGPSFPTGTRRVLPFQDSLAVLSATGLRYLELESAIEEEKSSTWWLQGLKQWAGGNKKEAYPLMTPLDWQVSPPMDACYNQERNEFLVYSRGLLIRLPSVADHAYAPAPSIDPKLPEGTLALLAGNPDMYLVGTNNSGVFRLHRESKTLELIDGTQALVPKSIVASPKDSSFAVIDANNKLWRVSSDGNQLTLLDVKPQGKISAVAIDDHGDWWLAHDVSSVSRWRPETDAIVESYAPPYSLVERIFYSGIQPLYWVNPKPAAVDSVVLNLLTDRDPRLMGRETSELQVGPQNLEDPWFAIWSNALFISTLVAVGCWYMYRQDL